MYEAQLTSRSPGCDEPSAPGTKYATKFPGIVGNDNRGTVDPSMSP